MRQPDFVAWMLLYPVTSISSTFVNQYLIGKTYSDGVLGADALISVGFWLGIGYLLYNKEG